MTPKGELDRIRVLLETKGGRSSHRLKAYKYARILATRWIEKYPNHLRLPEAYMLRGEANVKHGYVYQALYDFEKVATTYSDTEYFGDALAAEFKVADFMGTQLKKRRGFFNFRMIPADEEAVEIWIRMQERAPDSRLGESASLALAEYFANQSMIEEAAISYEAFLANYPKSDNRERVTLELIKTHMARFKGPEFDQSGLLEAKVRLDDYRVAYPGNTALKGAERGIIESLAEKALTDARWYEKRGKDVSAIYLYRRLLKEYSDTRAASKARKRLGELGVKLGFSKRGIGKVGAKR